MKIRVYTKEEPKEPYTFDNVSSFEGSTDGLKVTYKNPHNDKPTASICYGKIIRIERIDT